MKEFNYVPIYRMGFNEMAQGIEIKACEFCCKNCATNPKCQQFYKDLVNKGDGEYMCPYGFAVSIFSDQEKERYIFSSLRLAGVYEPKLADPKVNQTLGNKLHYRKITQEELAKYKEFYLEYKSGVESYAELKSFIEDIFHDVRIFNAQLKMKGERLCNEVSTNKKVKKFANEVQSIRAICAFMTLRLDAYNFMYNNLPMNATEKSSYNMFKVFDKVRHCLEERAKKKHILIDIQSKGECGDISAYDCIELLPYILIDNAIKYANNNSCVAVDIDDNPDRCIIRVRSQGIKLERGEKERIFVRGFRGVNAQRCTSEGLGIGLYTAKKICDLHNASIIINEEIDKVGNNIFGIDILMKKEYT